MKGAWGRLDTIAAYDRTLALASREGCLDRVKRELAKSDLFFLLVYVLHRKDANRDWLFDRCREVQAAPNGYLDLWARGHYKSTIITFALTIQDILRDPDITVGIFSFSRPIAKSFLRQIKLEFELNEDLRGLFPDILWENPQREAPKWSEDDGLIVRRKSNPKESTIEAWGLVDAQPTSKHFGLRVYDDVITLECVSNPEMIQKVTTRWEASLNLSAEGGKERYIGTIWHHAETYRVILDRKAAVKREYPCTVDGEWPGEPVLLDREELNDKYTRMGKRIFGSQMLMDPTADKSQGFLDEWLRYYVGSADYSSYNKYLLIDPASSKDKKSDYTCMVVIGLGSDNNFYLLDAVRDRLSLRERGDAVFSLHRRWKPLAVGYERFGMMADIEYIKERQDQENYRFDITELNYMRGAQSKIDRIRRMEPIFEAGRFHLPETLRKVDCDGLSVDLTVAFVEEEYKPFPVGEHDDMFDAISRIEDPEMAIVWPRPVEKLDRYARGKSRPHRKYSAMAA